MNAGKLRHSITLQNRVSTQNPVGGRTNVSGSPAFVNVPGVGNLRAAYMASGGSMYMGAGEAHTEMDCTFTIRFSTIPQQGMYILYNGAMYLVLAVNDFDGTRRWLQLPCKRER